MWALSSQGTRLQCKTRFLCERLLYEPLCAMRVTYCQPRPLRTPADMRAYSSVMTPRIRTRNFLIGTSSIVGALLFTAYYFDSRSAIHKHVIMPTLHALTDAESSHKFAIWMAKWNLTAKDKVEDDETLSIEVWGKKFSNPVGLAAGFDKNAEAIDSLFDMGFGYVEIGSVTPEPQPGNPQPRLFRLPHDHAVINRYGFNSDGQKTVESRLRDRIRRFIYRHAKDDLETTSKQLASSPDGASLTDALSTNRSLKDGKVLGINLGKNKASDISSAEDYVKGIKALGTYADVLVVNISSPNTPGLRGLQRRGAFEHLLNEVMIARNTLKEPRPPLLVKIAPDLSDDELEDIARAVLVANVDGVIISNTTISRPAALLSDPSVTSQEGGLSGPPVKPLALHALATFYKHTDGKIPLVGCGGISTGEDALEYARAGASLIQLYTSLGYDGVGKPREIKEGILKGLGGKRWVDIVGTASGDV